MKDLVLKVKDNEYNFVVNLLNKFDFIEIENIDPLTEEQKLIIDKRYEELKSGKVKGVGWDTINKILS